MKPEDLKQAIELIVSSNSVKASFNVPVKDSYSTVHDILIHECTPSLINQLIEKKFSLSMCAKGLDVSKI